MTHRQHLRLSSIAPIDRPTVEDEDLVFNGNSGAEAERFVVCVQRNARSEGKTRDQQWILDLVDSCMDGNALRWYLKRDPSIRNSWDALQLAILDKWSESGDSSSRAASPSSVYLILCWLRPPSIMPTYHQRYDSNTGGRTSGNLNRSDSGARSP